MKDLALTLPGMQGTLPIPSGVPRGGLGGAGKNIVVTLIQLLLLTAIVLALFYLIYAGFKWMTSGGDQEKLAGARSTIQYAIIGLVISALSFTIIITLGKFFGISGILTISN